MAAANKDNKSKSLTTHIATHQKNTIDLYGYFYILFHHNPQVRGSNPWSATRIYVLEQGLREIWVLFYCPKKHYTPTTHFLTFTAVDTKLAQHFEKQVRHKKSLWFLAQMTAKKSTTHVLIDQALGWRSCARHGHAGSTKCTDQQVGRDIDKETRGVCQFDFLRNSNVKKSFSRQQPKTELSDLLNM